MGGKATAYASCFFLVFGTRQGIAPLVLQSFQCRKIRLKGEKA